MQRALSVTELSPGEFVGRLDQMITVYAAAMCPPAEMLPGRRSIMAGHAAYPGFRALLATEDGSGAPAGFGYGFHGAAGQWWHDTVARALAAAGGTAQSDDHGVRGGHAPARRDAAGPAVDHGRARHPPGVPRAAGHG
ncbi:MAG TPA: hypothetical protein VGS06_30245, partial [Streptosporangiaceae bacterium]|nr:hypothetical protein [Streptosporangiaceae bacterium]